MFLSPAKINLGLWLKDKRPDGFHEILTLFHTIDLCDEIYIKEGPLRVSTSSGIPQEENLVYKALIEFWRATGIFPEVSIHIIKRIPEGAGLGGGSSNVAVCLKAVNDMTGRPLNLEELAQLAGKISSDAPFFILGGTAVGEGRGEKLTPLTHLELEVTLIIPRVKCSTKKVYSQVKVEDLRKDITREYVIKLVQDGSLDRLENRLGDIACNLYPEVGEVVRFLRYLGYKPLVSGSGSAVFYIGVPSPEVELGARLRGWRVIRARSWLGV